MSGMSSLSILVLLIPDIFAAEPDLRNPGVIIKFCADNPVLFAKNVGGHHQYDVTLDDWFFYWCPEFTGTLSPFTRIAVLIYAPSWNTDEYKLDSIGNDIQHPITIYSGQGSVSLGSAHIFTGLPCTGFTELAPDLGLFMGSVHLSGFQFDFNGDGEFDTLPFHGVSSCTNVSVQGQIPAAAIVRTEKTGGVTVAWEVSDGFTILKSINYTFREAQVNFEKPVYTLDDEVTVVMRDLDYYLTPEWEQPWIVRVWSDSDTAGIEVKVFWDFDKKFPKPIFLQDAFYGKFILTDTSQSLNSGRLRINQGDQIYVEFDDYSLPSPYGDGDYITLRDTAKVIFSHENPSGISLNSISLTNYNGEPINEVKKEATIQITSLIENHTPYTKTATHILMIQNSEGGPIEDIFWSGITLTPNSITDFSQSYNANNEGNYIAKSFVWENINNAIPLTESIETSFVVN